MSDLFNTPLRTTPTRLLFKILVPWRQLTIHGVVRPFTLQFKSLLIHVVQGGNGYMASNHDSHL